MELTSTSLLMRLREPSDRDAWSRFVELYTPLIFFWGRKAGLQPDDAADLVQDVLVTLVQVLPSFEYDQTKSFRGWLRRVTLNKYHERKRRKAATTADAHGSVMANLTDATDRGPAETFWRQEFQQHLVARAIQLMQRHFESTTWKACQEYVLSGRPADQVAEEFGLSVWTVYAAKSKLLKLLRQELDGMLD